MSSPGRGSSLRPSSALVWLTLLSLDAPIVAVLWQRLFARSLNERLGWPVTAALGILVWVLYVLDRILDSLRAPAIASEALRHRFYRAYRRFFLPPLFVALAAGAWIVLTRLDTNTMETGLVMMLAVGVYFFSVHFRPAGGESRAPKELIVAVLFTAGTTFPVWQARPGAHGVMLPELLIFTLLCWTNCAAIQYSESQSQGNERPGGDSPECDPENARARENAGEGALHPSSVWLGRNLAVVSLATAGVALGLLLFPPIRSVWPINAAEAISAAATAAIAWRAPRMRHDLFRVLMDMALFSPAVFLLL